MVNRHVALLRGINVGGKNKLPMARLVAMFEDLGASDIRTYIQSGNVVFEASASLAKALPKRVSTRIEKDLGLRIPVLVRSAAELGKVLREHPLQERGVPDSTLHVAFLADRPPASRVKQLDRERSPGDSFEVVGREVYLLCPNGMARTKLTNAWLDSTLDTVSTTRNWRTATKLLAMVLD